MVYRAVMVFHNRDNDRDNYPTHEIIFNAEDEEDAIQGVRRWIRNRQRTLPQEFGGLQSVKVGIFVICEITSGGYLPCSNHHPFWEWRCEAEKSLEEAVAVYAGPHGPNG